MASLTLADVARRTVPDGERKVAKKPKQWMKAAKSPATKKISRAVLWYGSK